MCKFDWKDGFFHFPIHSKWVDCFGILIPGPTDKYAVYRFLLFGSKSSPPLFQGGHMEIRRMLLANKLITGEYLVYVDDTLLASSSAADAWANYHSYISCMKELGVQIHDAKTIAPCQ